MASSLIFKYGTMSSGKSMQLLANAYSFQEREIPFVTIKSTIDNRDGSGVIHSRSLGDMPCIPISPNDNIINVLKNGHLIKDGQQIKFILVDEAQFMTEEQIDQLSDIVDNLNINVICYGLRTDFKTKLFDGSKRLFEIADSFEEIKSMCSCGNKTVVNARFDTEGEMIIEGEQVEVGGDDRYKSICRKCFKSFKTRITKKLKKNKNNNLTK